MISAVQPNNLLFLNPKDPSQSFKFPVDKTEATFKKMSELTRDLADSKQFYFKFSDVFSRPVNEWETVEDFLPLQPFYITEMIPKNVKLKVKLPNGEDFFVDMDVQYDQISKLMEKIEAEKKIPVDKQKIFFGEKQLHKGLNLKGQQIIQPDAEVNLVFKATFHIKLGEEVFDVYGELNNTVDEVKNLILAKSKIPLAQQILVFQGKELNLSYDDMLTCGVFDESTIDLKLKTNLQFVIFGETTKDFFSPSMKIAEIKEKLKTLATAEKVSILPELIDFEYQGNILDDEKTLQEYEIGKEATVQVKLRGENTLLVKLVSQVRTLQVCMQKNQSLRDLKKVMNACWRLDENKIEITYNGPELIDAVTFDTLNIEGDRVEMNFVSQTICTLYVKTLTGKTIEIEIDVTQSCESLKTAIQKVEGIPEDQQRLIYCGKQMEDNKPLIDYGIGHQCTIHLVLRLRGGGGPPMPFADITQGSRALNLGWSNSAPDWRVVTDDGLSLEGLCMNITCRAFLRWVIVNKGIGTYDLVLDQPDNKCPMCHQYVFTEKCAFSNCMYGYSGLIQEEDGVTIKKVTSQKMIEVGDFYKLFDPETVGKVDWMTLKIVTKRLERKPGVAADPFADLLDEDIWEDVPDDEKEEEEVVNCGICREKIEGEKTVLECAHFYHPACVEKIKDLEIKCALCHL